MRPDQVRHDGFALKLIYNKRLKDPGRDRKPLF